MDKNTNYMDMWRLNQVILGIYILIPYIHLSYIWMKPSITLKTIYYFS